MSDRRVIVVGTTSDYIDLIGRRYPGRSLFVTGLSERQMAREPKPDRSSEVLADLQEPEQVCAALTAHLRDGDITPAGITAYDCESMRLAALLADRLHLSYPSVQAIDTCRSKYATKVRWRERAVACPRTALVRTSDDVRRFQRSISGPIVIKPLTGSGSELTFRCADESASVAALDATIRGLGRHTNARMYADSPDAHGADPRRDIVAEEFVSGPEFSCDFVVDGERVEIIRIAEKLPAPNLTFGTTLAYIVPARLPAALDQHELAARLGEAARALGLSGALCMIDFIVRDGVPVFLELTPRPGGDCLPPLVLSSSGVDTLGLALDFAEGRLPLVPSSERWQQLVGVRLFAAQEGTIAAFDLSSLEADPRVRECYLKRVPGHRVTLPPNDYDSRLLGHVVFRPVSFAEVERECADIASKLIVRMENRHDPNVRRVSASGGRAAQAADSPTRSR